MSTTNYPERIDVNVHARLHLEHTDRTPEEHEIIEVEGTIESYPNQGDYRIVLAPQDDRSFVTMTSGPCIVLVIVFILDWPQPANSRIKQIREERELPPPQNFLDLSDGEYQADLRMNFEDGYAFKHCEMRKIDETHYEAFVETVHRYPSTKSEGIERILPHDVTLVDGGPGKLLGNTQVRWLREDGSILTGDVEIEVNLEKNYKRLCIPEVFSYEYQHGSFEEYPFTMDAKGKMRAVDTPPIKAEFNQ